MVRKCFSSISEDGALEMGDLINSGVLIVDEYGIVKKMNKAYSTMIGIAESDFIGKHVESLLTSGHADNIKTMLAIKEKKGITNVAYNAKVDKTLLIYIEPILNENDGIRFVLTIVEDVSELERTRNQLQIAKEKLQNLKDSPDMDFIGKSKKSKEIQALVLRVAPTNVPILITGETGCGKEVVARSIYQNSARSLKQYIKINCAAIPNSLIESELFGYEKGAFTGALNSSKLGVFEATDGGTLLLDEIGEMPYDLQSKLLRVIQEKEITRIGGTKSISIDVRILATTNKNLQEEIKLGHFREDLYYRLSVVPIEIPPLRERKEDIILLSNIFLKKFNKKYNTKKRFTLDAINLMERYYWPGNVREMENLIERLIITSNDNDITEDAFQLSINPKSKIEELISNGNNNLNEVIQSIEKEIIKNALHEYGSTYKAAKALGITQSRIFRKMKLYKLTDCDKKIKKPS